MRKTMITVGLLWIGLATVKAQSDTRFNADSLFSLARAKASDKNYVETRALCRQILNNDSLYFDARVLLGRAYAWEKDYDSARMEFHAVLVSRKTYWDALDGMIDLENWSGNPGEAMVWASQAVTYFPNDEFFLYKRASLYKAQGDEKAASHDLFRILQLDPANDRALAMVKEIRRARILNKLSVEYTFDYFEKPWVKRWHLIGLSYFRTTKIGIIGARINVGDVVMFNETLWQKNAGLQFEIEAYPRILDGSYLYMAYAFSPDSIFPHHRAGLEWYQRLPKGWEASLGGRYMQFVADTNNPDGFFTITASAGYYFHSFWISFRPYLTFQKAGISQSYNLEFRSYLVGTENFISVLAGYGNSVDDPKNYLEGANIYDLASYRIRLWYRQMVLGRLQLEPFVQYQYEEYKTSSYRNSWSFGLNLHLFF